MPQGFRALAKTPGYFALALAALALGVAAATVLFSVTESVLWRPLPFADSERLALLSSRNLKAVSEGVAVSRADFRDWRARAPSFTALAAMSYRQSLRDSWRQPRARPRFPAGGRARPEPRRRAHRRVLAQPFRSIPNRAGNH